MLKKNEIEFCFECKNMPCENLDRLDRRYRKHYDMSMVENFKKIRDEGINEFLKTQKEKYKCPKCCDVILVHDRKCYVCGYIKP